MNDAKQPHAYMSKKATKAIDKLGEWWGSWATSMATTKLYIQWWIGFISCWRNVEKKKKKILISFVSLRLKEDDEGTHSLCPYRLHKSLAAACIVWANMDCESIGAHEVTPIQFWCWQRRSGICIHSGMLSSVPQFKWWWRYLADSIGSSDFSMEKW